MENAAVEKEYIGDEELELGLGLSLGNASGGEKGAYGRILTAKDFPNGFACGTKRERAAADQKTASSSDSAAVRQVVGWPPIRSYRMNSLSNQARASNVVEEDESSKKKMNHGGHLGFVKVNMDGLPIGRKLDLNAHKTYQTLAKALEEMFFSPSPHSRGGKEQTVKLLDGSSEFVLTYEDKEGDWMLVGDVPWGMFLNTVKRLRIMRTSEANGLAPKSQERNEKQKSKLI